MIDFDNQESSEHVGVWLAASVTFANPDEAKYALRELLEHGRIDAKTMRDIHEKFVSIFYGSTPGIFTPTNICLVVDIDGAMQGYRVHKYLTDPITQNFSDN